MGQLGLIRGEGGRGLSLGLGLSHLMAHGPGRWELGLLAIGPVPVRSRLNQAQPVHSARPFYLLKQRDNGGGAIAIAI